MQRQLLSNRPSIVPLHCFTLNTHNIDNSIAGDMVMLPRRMKLARLWTSGC